MSTAVETFDDSDALAAAAGERLIGVVDAAIAARGRALVVLTGGGNGNRLMRFLAAHPHGSTGPRCICSGATIDTSPKTTTNATRSRPVRNCWTTSTFRRATCTPCRPPTANSATTWPPPHWPTSRLLAANAEPGGPAPISTFICSGWARKPHQLAVSRTSRRARDHPADDRCRVSPKPPRNVSP